MSTRSQFRNRFPLALVALSGTVRGLMKRRARAGLGVLAGLLLAMPALASDVWAGSELLQTPPGYTFDELSGNPLPPPRETGACCFADGRCEELTQASCAAASGTYQGDGTTCSPINPCVGACCFMDGSCQQVISQAACDALGGNYQGDGTVCDPNPCPQPPETGACCFADGHCEELTPASCTVANGTYEGDGTACDPNPCPQPGDVAPGSDLLETPPCYTYDDLSGNPLPAGFFRSSPPASDPWSGTINLEGAPFPVPGAMMGVDTIVERLDWADLPDRNGSQSTVRIRIVALSLVSVAPITVTFANGQMSSEYDVQVCLSQGATQPEGWMTITHLRQQGGLFDSSLPVIPRLIFTKRDPNDPNAPGENSLILDDPNDPALWFDFRVLGGCWAHEDPFGCLYTTPGGFADHDCDPNTPEIYFPESSPFPNGFFPGIRWFPPAGPCKKLTPEQQESAKHGIMPAEDPNCAAVIMCDDQDCNYNGIPDGCEVPPICQGPGCSQDCNGNLIPDECDIASGYSEDCQWDGIPDECQLEDNDCNANGIPDECDIASGTSQDCNANGIPDECDIASGSSEDLNGNGIPDECEGACCIAGQCTQLAQAQCQQLGGWHMGNGTACAPDPCQLPAAQKGVKVDYFPAPDRDYDGSMGRFEASCPPCHLSDPNDPNSPLVRFDPDDTAFPDEDKDNDGDLDWFLGKAYFSEKLAPQPEDELDLTVYVWCVNGDVGPGHHFTYEIVTSTNSEADPGPPAVPFGNEALCPYFWGQNLSSGFENIEGGAKKMPDEIDRIVRNPHKPAEPGDPNDPNSVKYEDWKWTVYSKKPDGTYVKGIIKEKHDPNDPNNTSYVFQGEFKIPTPENGFVSSDVLNDPKTPEDKEKKRLIVEQFEKEKTRHGTHKWPKRLDGSEWLSVDDSDGDGVTGGRDNCPGLYNPDQADSDCDGVGDACDICLEVYNPAQEDCNQNGVGDACEWGGSTPSLYELAPALLVPDAHLSGAASTIVVPDGGVIADLDVELQVDHPNQGDLIVILAHNDTTIYLVDRPGTSYACRASTNGYSADDFGSPGSPLRLDDCAATMVDCYDGTGTGIDGFSGPVHANRALAVFCGMNKAGEWTLTVIDAAPGNTGTLNYWSLRFEQLVMPPDWNGNGVPDECEGACCLSNGECLPEVSEAQCLGQSSVWQGAGSTCDPNPCEAYYCLGSGGCDEYIANVQIDVINNPTPCTNYGDYTALGPATLAYGVGTALTVTNGNPTWTADTCSVWIDYNHDYVWDDTTELVGDIPGVGPYVFTITPPIAALSGPTRMRIRIDYANGGPDPCGATSFGEVEDYTVNIVPLCVGDLNCDGNIDFGDINPFVLILTNLPAWQEVYPGCPWQNGDINADCAIDFGDINPFVALIVQCASGCPCPGPTARP